MKGFIRLSERGLIVLFLLIGFVVSDGGAPYAYAASSVVKYSDETIKSDETPDDPESGITDEIFETEVEGKFKDTQLETVFTRTETYKDSYFTAPSTTKNKDLAELSMLAAAAAYGREYAEDLIETCGFSVHKFEYTEPTEKKNDTVSYEIGIRKVNGINIVAVWVKGTSGDYEWISNWNLGKGTLHKGFNIAEKAMRTKIKAYLKSQDVPLDKSGTTKIWITGHSRGAAVANIFAKNMNSTLGTANVYAYTFASPRVKVMSAAAKKKDKKSNANIFNILNPGDFVTEVAPKKWGYERYGVDVKLETKYRSKMKEEFKEISGKEYVGFTVAGKNSLLNAFISYAGKTRKSYFKKNPTYTPEFFCKDGLGYILSMQKIKQGVKNCLKVAETNSKAKKVFIKMIDDGLITQKFGYAHTQLGYICWLEQMEF